MNVLTLSAAWSLGGGGRPAAAFAIVAAVPYAAWAVLIDALAGGFLQAGRTSALTHLAAWGASLVLAAALARVRVTPGELAERAELAAARRWLARECRRAGATPPAAWGPYLVALGLRRL
ncbi:MAG: hypothetical protein QM767_29195 [Anaeromyxobacter sp.]